MPGLALPWFDPTPPTAEQCVIPRLIDLHAARTPDKVFVRFETGETWTWAQLGFHQKPCGLFNVAGYYDRLAEFLDHTVASAFMQPQHRQMLAVDDNPATLLNHFEAYQPPTVSKWIASSAKA